MSIWIQTFYTTITKLYWLEYRGPLKTSMRCCVPSKNLYKKLANLWHFPWDLTSVLRKPHSHCIAITNCERITCPITKPRALFTSLYKYWKGLLQLTVKLSRCPPKQIDLQNYDTQTSDSTQLLFRFSPIISATWMCKKT